MRRIAAAALVVAAAILALGVAQLVLPGIAARRLRGQLSRYGRVLSISVSAFPAIELLWHHADSVTVRMASYSVGPSGASLRRLLSESTDAGTLHASAGVVNDGLLTLHDARLTKRGDTLTGSAQLDEADLRRAIPLLRSLTPLANSAGQLVLEGRAQIPLLGEVEVPLAVSVRDGALIAAPAIPLVGPFLTLTLFSDPGVRIDRVHASAVAGGFTVAARATVR